MILVFLGVMVAVVAADLSTKYTIDGILNAGISWGLGAHLPWLWMVIVVVSWGVAAGLIGWVVVDSVRGKKRAWAWTVGLALFVGGVLGNAIDRMISGGAVHDFIDFGAFKNNLADIAITVGAVLFMVAVLLGDRRAPR